MSSRSLPGPREGAERVVDNETRLAVSSQFVGAPKLELLQGEKTGTADARPVSASALSRTGQATSLGAQRVRIVEGALCCIARQGIAKTTLEDVARKAGCSRATVYRAFPGGKEALLGAVADTELSRFFSALAVRMGEASDIEEVLVAGVNEAAVRISAHHALGYILENEPEVVLPHLAFSHLDKVLHISSTFAAPFLGRWLAHEEAQRVAEWAARIILSYLACPAEEADLTDVENVRHLVCTFILPGVRVMGTDGDVRTLSRSDASVRPGSSVMSTNNRSSSVKGESK